MVEAGVQANIAKAKEYMERATYNGAEVVSWYSLGDYYMDRMEDIEASMFHFRVAAAYGDEEALTVVTEVYKRGMLQSWTLCNYPSSMESSN